MSSGMTHGVPVLTMPQKQSEQQQRARAALELTNAHERRQTANQPDLQSTDYHQYPCTPPQSKAVDNVVFRVSHHLSAVPPTHVL